MKGYALKYPIIYSCSEVLNIDHQASIKIYNRKMAPHKIYNREINIKILHENNAL